MRVLKYVHFKNPVMRSSFLSKALSFSVSLFWFQRKWQWFWKKWDSRNWVLKMNEFYKTSSFSSIWDQTGKSVKKVLSNHAYAIVLQSVRYPKNSEILDSSGGSISKFSWVGKKWNKMSLTMCFGNVHKGCPIFG